MNMLQLISRLKPALLALFTFVIAPSLCAESNAQAKPGSLPAAQLKDTETIDLGGEVQMEFVLIRPGSFMMGSDSADYDEKPVHKVTLTQPYYLGKYEVTQEQWEKVIGGNPSHFKGAKLPVENISWDDCQLFLAELRKKIGRKFALPTEAQWEYACRAGTTTTYSCGDDESSLSKHAWHSANSELTTHPVGQKKPNPWGLFDMHGNVFEWCADWYSESYPDGDATDPLGATKGDRRTIRGGAWLYVIDNLRSADRGFSPPDYRINEYGLRCVMLAGEAEPPVADATKQITPAVSPGVSQLAAVGSNVAVLPELKPNLVVDLAEGVTMEFVLIRPGSFTMGSNQSPLTNEKPAHEVTITQPYYLGKFEVTQKQWEAIMSRNLSVFKGGSSLRNASQLPVENVSWYLCQSFLAKLKEKIPGYEFRLPTEAEWEYACRAGTTGEYSFNDSTALDDHAWYGSNSGGETHPVGGKKPNAWGLYDMYGNVWEWCHDWYGPYSAEAVADPMGPSVSTWGGARVVRGGAWNNTPDHVNSAYRHDVGPDLLMRYYGFRCVAEIASSLKEQR